MPWSGFSSKSRELLEAKEEVDAIIQDEHGITYDFDLMEYVDSDGNVVPSEQVGEMTHRMMEERGYPLL